MVHPDGHQTLSAWDGRHKGIEVNKAIRLAPSLLSISAGIAGVEHGHYKKTVEVYKNV
jgi:hypothetical protein